MIYLGIFLYLGFLAVYYDHGHAKGGKALNYAIAYCLLVGLAGFRYKVGGDTYNYMYTHEFMPSLWGLFDDSLGIEKLQPLWLLLSAIAKSIGEDFFILQLMHAIIVNGVIFEHVKKNTTARFSTIFLYYFTLYPYFNFEILRESLAIACFLPAIKHYNNRHWGKYYFLSLLAFLFHLSAIFLFLLPFLRNIRVKPYTVLPVFALCALLNPLVMTLMASIGLTEGAFRAAGEYTEYNYTLFGLVALFLMYVVYPGSVFQISKSTHSQGIYSEIASKALLVGAITPLFFIFYRFFNYFGFIFVVLFAESLQKLHSMRQLRPFSPIVVIFAFGLFLVFHTARFMSDTSDLATGSRWYQRWIPYHSIFDPVSEPVRDQMLEGYRQ